MKDILLKYKKTIIIVVAIVLVFSLFSGRDAEDTAEQFVKSMFKGDAKESVSLMSDELIESSPYETKKLFIYAMEEQWDALVERYENTYGSSWKYKVEVIDSYERSSDGIVDVVVSIQHKGHKWFSDKEDKEELIVSVAKEGRNWYVVGVDH